MSLLQVSQEYEPLKNEDIDIQDFDSETISVFKQVDVQKYLEKVELKEGKGKMGLMSGNDI